MAANDIQVGGDHYKSLNGEEHWDRMWRLYGRGYFVGCITKYVERYHKKNGIEDLKKARHFLDKLIELESAKDQQPRVGYGSVIEKDKSELDKIIQEKIKQPTPRHPYDRNFPDEVRAGGSNPN